MASGNVTTKFKVDISDLKKSITEANRQVKLYRAELQNASAGMKKGEENADSLSRKIEAQSKIVQAEQQKLEALKQELVRYEERVKQGQTIVDDLTKKHKAAADAFGEDSEEAKKLAKQLADAQAAQERNTKAADDLKTKIVQQDTAVKNAQGQVQQFSDSLNELQQEEKETGDEAEKTTSGGLSAFAVALGNLASQVITKVVSGLGDLIKNVIETGQAFDTSLSKVKALSGASAEDMEKLTEKAEKMGETTKFTATEAADAMGYMAMAGWKTEEMLGGIDGVMNLAAASGADLATTSDIVTDSLTAFGKSAEDAGRLADIMAAAASNSNTNVEMMGETFKYAASLAGSLGYSMEDTAIATGLMANTGIKATQAGTSLRALLTRMAAPTKDSGTAMKELGLSLDDGKGNMKSLMEVMKDIRSAFGGLKISQEELTQEQTKLNAALEAGEMTEEDFNEAQEKLLERAYGAEGAMKAQYASMLAGKNGLSGFLAIVNASEEDFGKLTESIYNSKGAAEQMAQTMLDNLGGSLTLLSSAFDGVKKKIYNAISEPLNSLVKQITSNIMPALSGILTGDGGAGGKLADSISNLISNALKYANKILPGAVGALGTILGAIGTALVRQAPEATAAAEKLLEIILDGVIGAIPGMIKGGARIVKSLAEGLGDLLIHVADSIVGELPEILGAVFDAVPVIVKALLRMTEKVAAAIPEIVKSIAVFLPELVQGVADLIVTQTPIIIQSVITIFNGIVQALPEIIQSLVDALPSLIQTVTDFIANNAPMVLESVLMLVQALVQAAPQIAAAIYPMIPQIMDALVEGFMNFIPVWIDTAQTMFTMLAAALPGLWEDVKAAGNAIFEEWKTNIFDRAAKAFGEIWDHIKNNVTPVGEKIGNAVGDAFKTAVNTVLECVEEKLNTIPYTVNAILDKLNAVPGINLSPMGTVSLPRLARGGVIDKATIAQLGEAGREAVIPLDGDRAALREIADLLRSGMTSGPGGSPVFSGGNVTLTQNISSPKALSTYEVWRQTKNMLNLVETHLRR